MESQTKLYINIKTGEISFEGSEEFVSNQIERLEDIVSLIQIEHGNRGPLNERQNSDATDDINEVEEETTTPDSKSKNDDLVVPSVFGEWLHMFRDDINDQDKALITAYYIQKESENNDFKTSEINKSLKDHGIKLTNTSTTLKQIEKKKLIFQTKKVGKLSFKRVSADGVKHLKSLIS